MDNQEKEYTRLARERERAERVCAYMLDNGFSTMEDIDKYIKSINEKINVMLICNK